MRLIFLSALYPPQARGGGEISTHLLAKELTERGHDLTVITAGGPATGDTYQGVKVQRVLVPLQAKPLFERRATRRMARQLLRYVDTAAVLHAHDFRTALVLAELVRMGTVSPERAYATVRDYASICGTTHNILRDGSVCHCTIRDLKRTQRYQEAAAPRRYARLWQYWYNVHYRTEAFGRLPHHVYISAAQQKIIFRQARQIGGHAPYEKLQHAVIYNSVPAHYLTAPVSPGVDGTVLYLGTVEDYKGVDLLLAAWRNVARVNDQARLVIAGEGAQQRAYEQRVERAGLQYCVQFIGKVPWERTNRLYESAQVIVAPHRWVEPFGRTVAEAMAFGKIVVSAGSGGPAEMIIDGQNGFLFTSGSSEALTEKLLEALTVPTLKRREISAAARSWAREHLAPRVIAQQYEAFYRRGSTF